MGELREVQFVIEQRCPHASANYVKPEPYALEGECFWVKWPMRTGPKNCSGGDHCQHGGSFRLCRSDPRVEGVYGFCEFMGRVIE